MAVMWVAAGCRAETSSAPEPKASESKPRPPAGRLAETPPAKVPISALKLGVGDPAPPITLTLHDGSTMDLGEPTDRWVLVYFYPKDDTPGCTVEAQGFRDRFPDLESSRVTVIGVSLQDASSHAAFIDKYELPFPLAVDDGSAAAAFGVPVRGEFAARQSFLLRGGKVREVWRTVDPARHPAEVLAAVK